MNPRELLEEIIQVSKIYAQDAAMCSICKDPECWGNYTHYES